MSFTRGLVRHLSVGVLVVSTLAIGASAQQPQPTAVSRFIVLYQGVRVGGETVEVKRTDAGWVISSTGQIAAPLDLTTTRFEATYAADWQPLKLSIEGLLRGQLITLSTVFASTSATSDVFQGGQRASVTHNVSPRTIAIPNNFFAAYEALVESEPFRRAAQKRLAREVLTTVHGPEATEAVIAATEALFGQGDVTALDAAVLRSALEELPHATVAAGSTVVEALTATGLCASLSEARRAIAQGGVSLDGEKVTGDEAVVSGTLPGGVSVLRRGKKTLAGLFFD